MKNQGQGSRGTKARHFTIVELIIVMGVIGIIAGMSVGVMASLSTRKGAEGGARMISRQLFLCRDYAIVHRERVALAIPLGDTGGQVDAAFEDRYGDVAGYEADTSTHFAHATRPCIVDRNGVFLRWVPNTKWEFLPERVRLEAIDDTNVIPYLTGDFGIASGAYTISGIIFKPNGSLTVVDDIGNGDPSGDTFQVTDGKDQSYRMQVNWLTGKAKFLE